MTIFNQYKKQIAAILLVSFVNQIVFPPLVFGLTGGPSQPEVQSFEPVSTTQMVDPFTGDFNYNIPLMEIDGYPINIAYHSGVTTDQEASWVGLGWNLNPGVVNRNMRGLPDDFDGDVVEKVTHMNPESTIGANLGAGTEILGLPIPNKKVKMIQNAIKKMGVGSLSVGMNLGVNCNNYRGLGFDFSVVPTFNFAKFSKTNFTLAMGYSSQGGASINPKIGLSNSLSSEEFENLGLGAGAGLNINSREGLKAFTMNANAGYSKGMGKLGNVGLGSSGVNFSSVNFAAQNHTPMMKHPMNSINRNFNFKTGISIKPMFLDVNLSGYYNKQWLGENGTGTRSLPAYGMLNLENKLTDDALLDFNREKDGSFSQESPVLGIPQSTYDLYSISGQGVSGMFKAFRSDIPVFHDPETKSVSSETDLGTDVGAGIHIGVSVSKNYSESRSGKWYTVGSGNKDVFNELGFKTIGKDVPNNPLFEPSYFKLVGERTPTSEDYTPYVSMEQPMTLLVERPGKKVGIPRNRKRVNTGFNFAAANVDIKSSRPKRDSRNVFVGNRKASDKQYCLDENIYSTSGFGTEGYVNSIISRTGTIRKPHHTSELTVVNPDGNTYVYGIPAYNNTQVEYAFTYAKEPQSSGTGPSVDCETGEVTYDPSGITTTGSRVFKGIDHFLDKTTTPGYAHSYLLTHILSSDYVDVAGDGVSRDDLGTYVNINYTRKDSAYKWRVPYTANKANFNESLKSDKYDDNANFIYGEKEIWHVHSIEGRNHIAVFYTSPRRDALGVSGINGGKNNAMVSYKLDSIKLFSTFDLTNPIKSVYFMYNYKLCPGIHNNYHFGTTGMSTDSIGKLTLTELYFTYGNSLKGKYNSYKFVYSDFNPSYNLKAYDRWGNYKPFYKNVGSSDLENGICDEANVLLAKDFPYVEQNKESADQYSQAWTLTEITLPSGGKIEVTYEADDYGFVQNKVANQMYRLMGATDVLGNDPGNSLFNDKRPCNYLYFSIPQDIDEEDFTNRIIKDIDDLYFNVLVDLDNKGSMEYVKGYAKPVDAGLINLHGTKTGWIRIAEEDINDVGRIEVSAISLASWNFLRLYLPHLLYPGSNTIKSELNNSDKVKEFGKTLIGFFPEMFNMIRGINYKLRNQKFGKTFLPEKSWIRANNVTGYKYGGGNRVKKILTNDNWKEMEGSANSKDFKIGQEYTYTIKDGKNGDGSDRIISSGVASYEPMTGGDENPFKKPVYYERKQLLVPDVSSYVEEPFGESYFPNPSVGYSRVEVKTISSASQSDFKRNGNGKVVHEFYTAKDFPTIVQSTSPDIDEKSPRAIFTLILNISEKSLTMNQGYQIILNDMHGKKKAQWNYDQNHIESTDPAEANSGVSYEYFEKLVNGSRQLDNKISVISPTNEVSTKLIGVESEVIADSRQFSTDNTSGGIDCNLDIFRIGIIPIPVPSGIPTFNQEQTNFQSGVVVRVINTFGIQKSTTAFEEGATLKTENTLFDAETGEVLITKTQTEYNDHIYATTIPAHWVYDGMGPKYKNEGAEFKIYKSSSSSYDFTVRVNGVDYSPSSYFAPGDHVELKYGSTNIVTGGVWVHKTEGNDWQLIDQNGSIIGLTTSIGYNARVISSGRKNTMNVPVAQYSQLKNPVSGTPLNLAFNNSGEDSILSVQVTEYDQKWQIPGCYGFGLVRDTVKLYQDAVNIFNFLVKEGTISMVNAEAGYPTTDLWIYPNKRDYTPNFSSSASNLFANSQYKLYRSWADTTLPTTISSIQVKRFNSNNKHFNFNYDLGYKGYNVNGKKLYSYWAMSVSFDADNSTEASSLSSKTLDSVSFIPGVAWNDDKYYMNLIYGTTDSFPKARMQGNNCLKIYFTDGTQKIANVDIIASFYREWSNYGPIQKQINPYLAGVRNQWRPKKQWVYVTERTPGRGKGNLRRSGTYGDFSNFWVSNSNNWAKASSLSSKWQFTKETTMYDASGVEIESRNPLNIYNSTLVNRNTKLPYAVANNAKKSQIFSENFEVGKFYYNASSEPQCPASHSMVDPISSLIDTVFAHSGNYSYKVNINTRLLKTYTNAQDRNYQPGQNEFTTDTADFISPFQPSEGDYIVSGWVKVGNTFGVQNYSGAKIRVVKSTSTTPNDEGSTPSGSYVDFAPSGPIIDGWQKIEGSFSISNTDLMFSIRLLPSGSTNTYFDDVRIFPSSAIMKSYVFEPIQLKMVAELDENNYATFYEYDKSGNLSRIKKETEKGIVTIQESRNSFRKAQ